MANLTYKHGTMGSGKSMALMMGAYNLEKIDKKIVVIKSSIDTKADDRLQTRIGIERKVDILLAPEESLTKYFEEWKQGKVFQIFVDEAQFLTEKQVQELWYFTKKYDIPVECYGLKTQFDLHFFQGSAPLMELADEIVELPTPAICSCCGEKASVNARYLNGKIELPGGERIVIDGSNSYEYKPLCGNCYIDEVENMTGKPIIEVPKKKVKRRGE